MVLVPTTPDIIVPFRRERQQLEKIRNKNEKFILDLTIYNILWYIIKHTIK